MKTAFTSKRIGVTAAALVLSALLVGGTAGAANAYTYDPTLSVSTKALKPGALLQVRVNDAAPNTFTVTFNGVTSKLATPTFKAPTKVGTYELVLRVSGKVVDEVAITEGTKLKSISLGHTTITHNKAFRVTGRISPIAHVSVLLEGATGNGGYKILGSTTSSAVNGTYGITGKFTTKGKHYLKVVTIATGAYTSVSAKSAAFNVK
jgi:hypothetical protein